MKLQNPGRALAIIAAGGFVATALLHGTGYRSVGDLAAGTSPELAALAPALWLSFSLHLAVLGLIVAAVAWRPAPLGRPVLTIAALGPASGAALQIAFLGFIPPTAILLTLSVVTLAAAALLKPRRAHPDAALVPSLSLPLGAPPRDGPAPPGSPAGVRESS